MRKILLILLLVAGPGSRAWSQASLRVNYIYGSDVDTITPSTSQCNLFGVNVGNVSLTAFSDLLNINVGVIDTLGQVQVMDIVDVGLRSIPATDTILIDTVSVNVNTSYFVDGNNTVVIWPAASGTYTYDSLYVPFTYSFINESIAKDIDVHLGPNPAFDNIFLGDPVNLVKRVRIRTLDGRLVREGKTNAFIWVGDLHQGVYVVELESNQKIFTRKLVVQR